MKQPNARRFQQGFLIVAWALLIWQGLPISATHAANPQKTPIPSSEGFAHWLTKFYQRASDHGVSEQTINAMRQEARFLRRVLELDRRQPEFTLTASDYLKKLVSEQRIQGGNSRWRQHAPLLQQVSAQYGVSEPFLLAFWAIETNFGANTGRIPILSALATLAYDPRRSQFFERQLIAALQLLDEQVITLDRMRGAWAGAMGQMQFLPTSYASYAVDFDGDGYRNLWDSLPDVFASAANYLKKQGWQQDLGWGTQVNIPAGNRARLFNQRGNDHQTSIGQWRNRGMTLLSRTPPQDSLPAYLLMPDGENGLAFLVWGNFESIMRWNRSHLYALAIGLLSDQFRKTNPNPQAPPTRPQR